MPNRNVVLWSGRDLWVEAAQSNLHCFALCRKTAPNKQRAAKPCKMAINWAGEKLSHGYTEKATTVPSLCKCRFILYLCLYFYILTTILSFSCKIYKSFVLCKTVSKHAVIYAPNLRYAPVVRSLLNSCIIIIRTNFSAKCFTWDIDMLRRVYESSCVWKVVQHLDPHAIVKLMIEPIRNKDRNSSFKTITSIS